MSYYSPTDARYPDLPVIDQRHNLRQEEHLPSEHVRDRTAVCRWCTQDRVYRSPMYRVQQRFVSDDLRTERQVEDCNATRTRGYDWLRRWWTVERERWRCRWEGFPGEPQSRRSGECVFG